MNRRAFLVGSGAVLGASAVRPTVARAQAPRGHIIAGLSERMLTLDPANHYSISATSVLRHVYDPLLDVTNDDKFVPALAESWRPVNNTTWKFTLRKGVTFHDGTPFNADSVVFTLKRVRDGKLIKSFVYQDIEDVQKDGDYAVTVTTKRPFGSLPAHLTMLGMLPPSVAGAEEAFFQKPVGTGPFRFVSWTHGDHVDLAANPKYWKPGIPKVEKVTVRFIPELSTRAAALRAGEIHVIDRVWPDMVQTLKGTPGVEGPRHAGRRGAALALPARARHREGPARAQGHLAGHRPQRDHQGPAAGLRPSGREPGAARTHRPHEPRPEAVRPREGQQLLKQAGQTNLAIDFVLMKDLYPKQLEIAQAVAAMLGEVGIKVNIRNLEIATAREQRTAGNYDLFFSGWAHMPHDPDWYFGQWFTKAGAEKMTRFNDPKVEQLIAEGRVPDPKVRQQKYEEIERILWEDEPEIWPYYSVAIYAISDKLRNFEARRDYYVLLSEVGIA